MFPYWLLFSLFAAGAVQTQRANHARRGSSIMLGFIALAAVLMIGFRYQTGADWEPYLYIYQSITYMNFEAMLATDDPGYSFLNWVANALGLQIWAVNLACSALFVWGLVTFAKHQPHPWLALVVAVPYLIIVVAIGYTRQAVAIGLFMASIVAWDRRQLVRFAILILVAVTFHKTAVLALPLIALSQTRNRLLTGLFVLVFAILLYWTFLEDSVDRMLINYVEREYSSEGAAVRVAMNVLPALIYLSFQKQFDVPDGQRSMWRNFSLATLGTVVLLFALPSSTAVDRIALYLLPLQLFVFSRLPDVFGRKEAPSGFMIGAVIAYSALIQFVWLNYAVHAEYWVPYQLWPITEEADTSPF